MIYTFIVINAKVLSERLMMQVSALCVTHISSGNIPSAEFFFIVFPLLAQLKDLLENHHVAHRLLLRATICAQEDYIDILSGNNMRSMVNEGVMQNDDFTVLWNMDGAQAFKFSNFAYWPFFLTVNELSCADRNKNMLMCGMWFGSDKPVMSTYMQPITEELKLLSTTGFNWISPIHHTNTHSRVFLVAATCDAVAHPMIRNCIQFNGKYGCWKCYHPGERVEKGNGHVNCYPFRIPKPQLRMSNYMKGTSKIVFWLINNTLLTVGSKDRHL